MNLIQGIMKKMAQITQPIISIINDKRRGIENDL